MSSVRRCFLGASVLPYGVPICLVDEVSHSLIAENTFNSWYFCLRFMVYETDVRFN